MTRCRVHLLAFDGMEALDFAGPFEVFTTASRVAERLAPAAGPRFDVASVARSGAPVRARAGMRLLPELDFSSAGACDLLVVPGGVVDGALACRQTLDWLRVQAGQAAITASVCTGVFLLAAAGLVTDGPVTTHWEDVDDLRQRHPGLQVMTDARWVDRGRWVTSAGISAGIDMSLHLVERLGGRVLAERTARQMDYAWRDA